MGGETHTKKPERTQNNAAARVDKIKALHCEWGRLSTLIPDQHRASQYVRPHPLSKSAPEPTRQRTPLYSLMSSAE